MREKELRLALVCYGGVSLAVYMHGVTKEIWRLARASRAEHDNAPPSTGVEAAYRELIVAIGRESGTRIRILADIVAGASAGGINGIFLSRAISTGESLDPLTDLWLDKADVTVLLDPDARPWSRFSKFWAVPIAWLATRGRKGVVHTTVERGARAEVRAKLSQFVRARWFAPPFGGEVFTGLLLDAFDAMAAGPKGLPLVPNGQPIDLMVTVTDFDGHPETMYLNSPREVEETEHRLIFSFRHAPGMATHLDDPVGLTFAARATASFPGAFPLFSARELDRVLAARGRTWPQRSEYLTRQLPGDDPETAQDRVLTDGSVLANAPFRPAIAVLRQRPARREVDRRFVYIDPTPGGRGISLTGHGMAKMPDGSPMLPGFFAAIFKTISDIPREQPIRDNVEAIEALSERTRRMRAIVSAMQSEVEDRIEAALGRTFFIDRPTPARLASWRASAQQRAAQEAGSGFIAYGHLKLAQIVEGLAAIVSDLAKARDEAARISWRNAIWAAVRQRGLDRIAGARGVGGSDGVIDFFRTHDVGFRIRRLRFLARQLDDIAGAQVGSIDPALREATRVTIYECLAPFLDRESSDFYFGIAAQSQDCADCGTLIDQIGARRDLKAADAVADAAICDALAALPKAARRAMLFAYLGFPFYDSATLPLLQGEGQGEFDPIKIDRIAPEDATAIRQGGAQATLKGIQFNNFGAFFSRAFRENDYLWGRLHAAERLFAIVESAMPKGSAMAHDTIARIRRDAFRAILDEEQDRLHAVPELIAELRAVVG